MISYLIVPRYRQYRYLQDHLSTRSLAHQSVAQLPKLLGRIAGRSISQRSALPLLDVFYQSDIAFENITPHFISLSTE